MLVPHASAFTTIRSQSAPVRRGGLMPLLLPSRCAVPLARRRTPSAVIGGCSSCRHERERTNAQAQVQSVVYKAIDVSALATSVILQRSTALPRENRAAHYLSQRLHIVKVVPRHFRANDRAAAIPRGPSTDTRSDGAASHGETENVDSTRIEQDA